MAAKPQQHRRRSEVPIISKPTVAADPTNQAITYAVRIVHGVCCLAGPPSFINELQQEAEATGIAAAVANHDTPALYDALVAIFSHQGISDQIAANYLKRHGSARWRDIQRGLAAPPSCSKLNSYWQFHDCRYEKTTGTCAEPEHLDYCPLTTHRLDR